MRNRFLVLLIAAFLCGFAPTARTCYEWAVTVTFRLRFRTQPGQSLWLTGGYPMPDHPMPMQYVDAECWQITVPLSTQATGTPLKYSYILRQPDGAQVTDWGQDRSLVPASFNATELLVVDSWNNAGFAANVFYTAPCRIGQPQTIVAGLRNLGHFFGEVAPVHIEQLQHCFAVRRTNECAHRHKNKQEG